MATVRQLLQQKGDEIWHVTTLASVMDALKLMSEKDIGAVLVLENGNLHGIFSERDYARLVEKTQKPCTDFPISEVMTQTVFYVRPEQTIEECMALMTDKHFRHLPVMQDSELVGVISIGDVVKEMISDRESIIRGLENYITGRELSI